MSVLRRRIAEQPTNAPRAMGDYHPVAPHPHVMPMTVVEVTADHIGVTEAAPLWTARTGAPVPATAPGQWDQLHAAGRP